MSNKGKLFVISAPSGAGKSTLIKGLFASGHVPDYVYAVSHTSRAPRPGEVDGVDYVFVSPEEFLKMTKNGEFLEWTTTFGNYYGTSKTRIEAQLASGLSVITDVDVVGAKNIKDIFPEAILIFIAPPSFQVLQNRLEERHTESQEDRDLRLKTAESELAEIGTFDYLIINDNLEIALNTLIDIVTLGKGPKAPTKEELWAEFFKKKKN
jgi:guanylate kinase